MNSKELRLLHDLVVWARWMLQSNCAKQSVEEFLDNADYVGGLVRESIVDHSRVAAALEEMAAKYGCRSARMHYLDANQVK
mgnify:CR=1 FL=1